MCALKGSLGSPNSMRRLFDEIGLHRDDEVEGVTTDRRQPKPVFVQEDGQGINEGLVNVGIMEMKQLLELALECMGTRQLQADVGWGGWQIKTSASGERFPQFAMSIDPAKGFSPPILFIYFGKDRVF